MSSTKIIDLPDNISETADDYQIISYIEISKTIFKETLLVSAILFFSMHKDVQKSIARVPLFKNNNLLFSIIFSIILGSVYSLLKFIIL
jgi:hypothetical protein